MKKILLLALLAICAGPPVLMAQEMSACLQVKPQENNVDKVAIDTCTGSATYRQAFARYWFSLDFDASLSRLNPGIERAGASPDVDWKSIAGIRPDIERAFRNIEEQFGEFVLVKQFPSVTDPSLAASRSYLVRFIDYVPVEAVASAFNSIQGAFSFYRDQSMTPAYVPNDKGMVPRTPWNDMLVQGTNGFWPIHFHKLGWQWNIYRSMATMAWEITRGDPDVTVLAADIWNGTSSHPDMTGFYQVASSGDGTVTTRVLGYDHGLTVLSCAIGRGDNDTPDDGNPVNAGQGMVGTGFGISGVATPQTVSYATIDLDGTANGSMEHIAAANFSFGGQGGGNGALFKAAIDSGIVLVAAAGNDMGWNDHSDQFSWSQITVQGQDTIVEPATIYPSAYAWAGATPQEDVRMICVGATKDGVLRNGDCEVWHGPDDPNWKGTERFAAEYTFSVGTDKFNTNGNSTTRVAAKESARMDVLAPVGLVVAYDGANGTNEHLNQYHPNNEGTSQAAPQIAGIAGLMLSVNNHMGINIRDVNGQIVDGARVQRKAYDILTFTADKIQDSNNIPTIERCIFDPTVNQTICWKYKTRPTPTTDYQFDYITQTNDALDRSWAQRNGFGRVNAYRAVAHSIANKGAFTYTTSQTLPFSFSGNGNVNEDGDALMHFGAWKNNTDLVLDAGGESLPGESHNNQGVTKVNGTGTVLTVPNDCILAIDGIVKTDNATGNNQVVTSGTGKICAAGYLENVELKGTTRLADLIVRASGVGAVGRVSIGSPSLISEIYGNVKLRDNGELRVDQGTMKVRPGGIVDMQGAKDIVVTGGGIMELHAASTVTGGAGRQIIVESGAKLIVMANAKNVEIHCNVLVRAGGQFVIEPDAEVTLDQFTVNPSGTMTCKEGSRLILYKQLTNLNNGVLTIEGTSTKRARVSARVADCCRPTCTQVNSTATIMSRGSAISIMGSKLRIRYADITNVPIKVLDMRRDPIEFNNFSASRALLPQGDYLLSIDFSGRPWPLTNITPLMQATVRNNTFFDEAGGISTSRRTAIYPINGLKVRSMLRGSTITSNTFTHIGYGVASLTDGIAQIQNNTFTTCNVGVYDIASSVNVCSNAFSDIDYAGIFYQTKPSKVLNNVVNTSRWGFTSWNASQIDFRNNNLQEFVFGLYSIESPLNLRPRQIGGTPPQDEVYGRNVFGVTGVLFPFGIGTYDIMLTAAATLTIQCGKNDMALNTVRHISGVGQFINVGNNRWNDPNNANGAVRTNVGVTGTPLNVAAGVQVSCSNVLENTGCIPAPGQILPCEGYPYYNTGNWTQLSVSDALLSTYFSDARTMMYDAGIDVNCRKVKARDAMEAAIRSDSIQPMLVQLVGDYTAISNNLATPMELKSTVVMLKGEASEHLGLFSDAENSYSKVVTQYPSSPDSVPAAWRLQYLQAMMADTTFGPAYDSLLALYGKRVIEDLRRVSDEDEPLKRNLWEESTTGASLATLEQNAPNPFGKETAIAYTLHQQVDVRLEVLDLQGTVVSVLVNENQSAGNYTATFSTQGIAAGTYLYRLTTGEQVQTRQMVVVK